MLWSAPVFSRLWCVFELVAYRKLNPTGRITIAPLHLGVFCSEILLWSHAAGFAWVFVRVFSSRQLALPVMALIVLCLFPLAHSYRQNSLYRRRLISSLDTFDVKGVECLNEFDRKYIHAAIVEPFLREVRVPVLPPLGSMLLLTTAMISASLDYVVGLLKAGAPTQSIMAYIVAIMVFSFGCQQLLYSCSLPASGCRNRLLSEAVSTCRAYFYYSGCV